MPQPQKNLSYGDEFVMFFRRIGGSMEIIVLLFLGALYFLPTIMAMMRNHHNGPAIFALNLLLGWTAIGWIVAIVWSFTSPQKKVTKVMVEAVGPKPQALAKNSTVDELERLVRLRNDGAIDQDEFLRLKEKALGD